MEEFNYYNEAEIMALGEARHQEPTALSWILAPVRQTHISVATNRVLWKTI